MAGSGWSQQLGQEMFNVFLPFLDSRVGFLTLLSSVSKFCRVTIKFEPKVNFSSRKNGQKGSEEQPCGAFLGHQVLICCFYSVAMKAMVVLGQADIEVWSLAIHCVPVRSCLCVRLRRPQCVYGCVDVHERKRENMCYCVFQLGAICGSSERELCVSWYWRIIEGIRAWVCVLVCSVGVRMSVHVCVSINSNTFVQNLFNSRKHLSRTFYHLNSNMNSLNQTNLCILTFIFHLDCC